MDIRHQGQWYWRTLLFAAVTACGGSSGGTKQSPYGDDGADAGVTGYVRIDLVSDEEDAGAANVDENLINPWGIAFGPETPFWVANEGSGTATAYSGTGESVIQPVSMPQGARNVTGLVFHGGENFEIGTDATRAPAQFIFATEQGAILGWSPEISGQEASVAVEAPDENTAYTGLALAARDDTMRLYAANFKARRIDVFDEQFAPAEGLSDDAFVDPELPEAYVPYGVHALGERIYVTYAEADEDREEEVRGRGKGYVSVFDTDGTFIERVASQGTLDAPWGMARAPETFGQFGDALLVGNFGDGRINAYDPESFAFLGQLEDAAGEPIEIDGLWGLVFGNDEQAGSSDALYFTAGPEDEEHGLFGRIEVARPRRSALTRQRGEHDR